MKQISTLLIAILCIANLSVKAQFSISGLVYSDYDNSATPTPSSNEGAIGGVIVKAYNASDVQVATAATTGSGASNYSLASLPNGSYRLEFTNLPAGYFSSPAGNTSVQFVTVAGANVTGQNFGVNYPTDYIQANPFLYTNQFTNDGIPSPNTGIVLRYARNGVNSNRNEYIASYGQVGDVLGLATQGKTQRVFTSAYYRLGATGVLGGDAGLGKIYVLDGNYTYTPPLAPAGNLIATITIPNAGTIPVVNPAQAVGKIGLGSIAISDDGNTLWAVNLNDRHLYRVDITNSATPGAPVDMGAIPAPAALSGRPGDWRPFALKYYHGKLYVGGVSSGQTNNTVINAADGDGNTPPSPLFANANYDMYTITDNIAEVAAYVMEIAAPLTSVAATEIFAKTDMGFPRGRRAFSIAEDARYTRTNGRWRAWFDTKTVPAMTTFISFEAGTDGTNIFDTYLNWPMPMLTGLEFEANGSLILGFRERSNDMIFSPYGAGDINKACWVPSAGGTATLNGVAGNWFWEGTPGSCDYVNADPNQNSPSEPDAAAGFGMLQTREWFFNDYTTTVAPTIPANFSHEEQSFGSLAYKPVFTDVAAIAMNPIDGEVNTSGVEYFTTSNGGTTGTPGSYKVEFAFEAGRLQKENSLGDVEYMADLPSMEIGNRVWNDTDGDGIQEPGEPGIGGVEMELLDALGTVIATVTTDANGTYYFSSATGANAPGIVYGVNLLPNSNYTIRVKGTVTASNTIIGNAGLGAANYLDFANITGNGQADLSDNDAAGAGGVGGTYQVSITTGGYGQNNHSIDFGFTPINVLPVKIVSFTAQPQGSQVVLTWVVADQTNINSYEVEYSTTLSRLSSLTSVAANNILSTTYNAVHPNPAAGINYYRIKVIDKNGAISYSDVRKVNFGKGTVVSVYPNPAKVEVNLTLTGSMINKAATISVISVEGKVLSTKRLTAASQTEVVDVSQFASGKYIIRIVTNNEVINKTIEVIK
jgi:trimeric autotransporter adhesin